MDALEKHVAKKRLITKLAQRVKNPTALPNVPVEAPTPKSLLRKRAPKNTVAVPITDPNDGRIFSHKERWDQQSLPKNQRGPSWKDTHPPNEQVGMPKGPMRVQPTDKQYWLGK